MTKEQIEKLGVPYKEGITDDEVFEALSKRQGELQAEKDKAEQEAKNNKSIIDKYSSEIATLKDEKRAKMTDEEKIKERITNLENENATLKKDKSVAEREAKYVKMGYNAEDAHEVALGEIEGKDVSEVHARFLKYHDEEHTKELMKANPNLKGGGTPPQYTKEDFKNGRISMEEMNKLKETDPTLYAELIK